MENSEVTFAKDTDIVKEVLAAADEAEQEIATQESSNKSVPNSVIEELDKLKAAHQAEDSATTVTVESLATEVVEISQETAVAESIEPQSESKQEPQEELQEELQEEAQMDSEIESKEESTQESKEETAPSADESTVIEATSVVETPKTDEPKIDQSKIEESSKTTAMASASSPEANEKSTYNKDFWKSVAYDFLLLFVFGFFFVTIIQKWFYTQQSFIKGTNQIQASIESGAKTQVGNINVLVMGIDSVEGTHRSDTIFVLSVNPSKKKVTMLSIPRDTRVIIEDKGRKINEILPRYGEPTLRKILEELLGISISRKAEVGFESFISLINGIGGVDINIEKAMHYDDNWGNLHIHFEPGWNHLDGQQALNYVRFRKDAMADLGRIKRQQDFVKSCIKKATLPSNLVRLPSIIEECFKYVETDFTLHEILTLAKGFEDFDIKLTTMSLPGEARYIDKISFFLPYAERAKDIGNSYFSDLSLFELEKPFTLGKADSQSNNSK